MPAWGSIQGRCLVRRPLFRFGSRIEQLCCEVDALRACVETGGTDVRKGLHKRPVLEFCDELGHDTASYEPTIERKRLQGKVPCFRAVVRRKKIQRLLRHLGLRNFSGWIADLDFFREPGRFVLFVVA